jgi:hypothetical protein
MGLDGNSPEQLGVPLQLSPQIRRVKVFLDLFNATAKAPHQIASYMRRKSNRRRLRARNALCNAMHGQQRRNTTSTICEVS